MKITGLIFALFLISGQVSAKTLNCFSKYYGANNNTIEISATIESDDTVTNVKVQDDGDSFLAQVATMTSVDGNHRETSRYAKYQDYEIANDNKDRYALGSITLLLPKKLTQLQGQFDAYASDPNADASGSNGYQRVLCKVK